MTENGARLSRAEREVLREMCRGGGSAGVAERTFREQATVRGTLSRVYRKLGITGTAHKAARACYLLGRRDERRKREPAA